MKTPSGRSFNSVPGKGKMNCNNVHIHVNGVHMNGVQGVAVYTPPGYRVPGGSGRDARGQDFRNLDKILNVFPGKTCYHWFMDNMDNNVFLDELEGYRANLAELDTLRQMRQHLYDLKSPIIARQGSVSHANYDRGLKTVQRIEEMDARITAKEVLLIEKTERIYSEVMALEDGFMKKMIILHYVMGYDWGKVCYKVYGYHSYQTCRKAVMRYFGKEK